MGEKAMQLNEQAIEQYGGFLRRLARSLLFDRSEAEDIVQRVWLRALQKAPRDHGLKPWLAGAVRLEALQSRREQERRKHREDRAPVPASAPEPPDSLARMEILRQLMEAVESLAEPYRSVILDRYFEGHPPRRIAKRHNKSVHTIRTWLTRGLAQLRAKLQQRQPGSGAAMAISLWKLAGAESLGGLLAAATAGVPALVGVSAVKLSVKGVVGVALSLVLAGSAVWWVVDRTTEADLRAGEASVGAAPERLLPKPPPLQSDTGSSGVLRAENDDERRAVPDSRTSVAVWTIRGKAFRGHTEGFGAAKLTVELFPGTAKFIDRFAVVDPLQRKTLEATADGGFECSLQVPRDTVTLQVVGREQDYLPSAYQEVFSLGDEPPQDVEVHLLPVDASIAGQVQDLKGRPIADAQVLRSGQRYAADEAGWFRIPASSLEKRIGLLIWAAGYAGKREYVVHPRPGIEELFVTLGREVRVRGRVVDGSDDPVAGARIHAFGLHGPPVFTAVDGHYELGGLDPQIDRQNLYAGKEGWYQQGLVSLKITEAGNEAKDLVLVPGVSVSGRVRAEAGVPMPEVRVFIGVGVGDLRGHTTFSDEGGNFSFQQVGPGSRVLGAQVDGFAIEWQTVEVHRTRGLKNAQILLQPAHTLVGQVLSPGGSGVNGALVLAYHGENLVQRLYADRDGRFALKNLPGEQVMLRFSAKGYVYHYAGVVDAYLDRDDYRCVLESHGVLLGQVLDARTQNPIEKFTIRLLGYASREGDKPASVTSTWAREGHRFQRADGRFDSGDLKLQPGHVVCLEAHADSYLPLILERVVVPQPGNPENLRLEMEPASRVVGVVLDDDQQPIAGARVHVQGVELGMHDVLQTEYSQRATRTAEDGSFALHVSPGSCTLQIELKGRDRRVDGPFDVAGHGATVHRVVRLDGGGVLRGTLWSTQESLAASQRLMLVPLQVPGRVSREKQTVTGRDGSFEFSGLPDGSYFVGPAHEIDGELGVSRSYRVDVRGKVTRCELRPAGTQTLHGRVRSTAGVQGHVQVMVLACQPGASREEAVQQAKEMVSAVAERGEFVLQGLGAGTHSAFAYGDGQMGRTDFVIQPGEVAQIEIALRPPGER